MKCTKRILAVLLAIAMTICLLPAEAMAKELSKTEEMSVGAVASEEEVVESEETVVIGEDESRRDQNTKHFILSDGSRRAVLYSDLASMWNTSMMA